MKTEFIKIFIPRCRSWEETLKQVLYYYISELIYLFLLSTAAILMGFSLLLASEIPA